jgi:type IV pilus assembly protein PilE
VIFSAKNKGFTLSELLIVIAIVGILVAIVMPSYQEHIRTSNRVVAQLALSKLAQEFERTSARQGDYSTITADQSTGAYNISLSSAEKTKFELIATPIAGSASAGDKCGTLSINQAGVTKPAECWD